MRCDDALVSWLRHSVTSVITSVKRRVLLKIGVAGREVQSHKRALKDRSVDSARVSWIELSLSSNVAVAAHTRPA